MNDSQQVSMLALWASLEASEQYADLAAYLKRENGTLRQRLTDFEASVCDDISSEAKENLHTIIVSICHPPPGCTG